MPFALVAMLWRSQDECGLFCTSGGGSHQLLRVIAQYSFPHAPKGPEAKRTIESLELLVGGLTREGG